MSFTDYLKRNHQLSLSEFYELDDAEQVELEKNYHEEKPSKRCHLCGHPEAYNAAVLEGEKKIFICNICKQKYGGEKR